MHTPFYATKTNPQDLNIMSLNSGLGCKNNSKGLVFFFFSHMSLPLKAILIEARQTLNMGVSPRSGDLNLVSLCCERLIPSLNPSPLVGTSVLVSLLLVLNIFKL